MRKRLLPLVLLLLGTLNHAPAQNATLARTVQFESEAFVVVDVDLQRVKLELHWRNPAGQAFKTFRALTDDLAARGEQPLALMNAGIFDTTSSPLGLHVERGKVLHRLNARRNGYGNFYLQPNGVFFLEQIGSQVQAQLLTTTNFARQHPNDLELGPSRTVLEATQSGPILLLAGKVNAAFQRGSPNRLIRNAIGVCSASKVALVLSTTQVNFHTLARFFRDGLKCPNALYLDGNVSSLLVPGTNLGFVSGSELGGMFVVLAK